MSHILCKVLTFISYNPHSFRSMYSDCYFTGVQSLESWRNLPRVMQLVSGRAIFELEDMFLQILWSISSMRAQAALMIHFWACSRNTPVQAHKHSMRFSTSQPLPKPFPQLRDSLLLKSQQSLWRCLTSSRGSPRTSHSSMLPPSPPLQGPWPLVWGLLAFLPLSSVIFFCTIVENHVSHFFTSLSP